jgi:hypothetical protein
VCRCVVWRESSIHFSHLRDRRSVVEATVSTAALVRGVEEGYRVTLVVRAVHTKCHAQLSVQRVTLCPICFEPAAQLQQLPHPFAPEQADVSGHRLCAACRERWPGDCPFCRSAPLPPPPKGYVGIWQSDSSGELPAATLATRPAHAIGGRLSRLRARNLSAYLGARLIPRRIRRSSVPRTASHPRMPCAGCRRGCLECDPDGVRLFGEDDWFRMETG